MPTTNNAVTTAARAAYEHEFRASGDCGMAEACALDAIKEMLHPGETGKWDAETLTWTFDEPQS